jgi:hypothetical protein
MGRFDDVDEFINAILYWGRTVLLVLFIIETALLLLYELYILLTII